MPQLLRTKIVCTIGPASREPEMLAALIEAGMDVARLNFSHGEQAFHAETIARIRAASAAAGKPIAILGDLQGPKLRVGIMQEGGVPIAEGETLALTTEHITGAAGPCPRPVRAAARGRGAGRPHPDRRRPVGAGRHGGRRDRRSRPAS